MPTHSASLLVRVAAVVAVAGLVGCGGSGGGGGGGGDEAERAATPSSTMGGRVEVTTPVTTAAPTTAVAAVPVATPAADGCGETSSWGTGPQDATAMSADDLYLVRVGRHSCFDRIVFDVNGAAPVGFHLSYVDGEVLSDGEGAPVPTSGDAALQIVVRSPALGYGGSGHQPGRFLARMGEDLVAPSALGSLKAIRQVRFAGSFEGQTTIAVGVTSELPFRVGSYERDGYAHVYVDIAHR
jgi:hypothetical protein